jgi:MOSC domain-containing protein YiiM
MCDVSRGDNDDRVTEYGGRLDAGGEAIGPCTDTLPPRGHVSLTDPGDETYLTIGADGLELEPTAGDVIELGLQSQTGDAGQTASTHDVGGHRGACARHEVSGCVRPGSEPTGSSQTSPVPGRIPHQRASVEHRPASDRVPGALRTHRTAIATSHVHIRQDVMSTGRVEALCIAPEAGAEMQRVEEVEAVAGKGLRGDRYFEDAGTWSNDPTVDDIPRHLTLFEAETLAILERDEELDLSITDHRRNVTTRDVALDHLLDERFRIGEVVCEGVRLCEPCAYLQERTESGVLNALVHRGGLNAAVVESGIVRVDDPVEVVEAGR